MSIYYLSSTGTDAPGGGSISAPFATLKYAHDNFLQPGDMLWVRGGLYVRQWLALGNWTKSGTSGNPIRIAAYPGETPIFTEGTLHTWTWLPSTYGGCWSASVPGLSAYQVDEVNSVQWLRNWVPEGFRACSEMRNTADFTSPASVGGGQLVDGGGNLLWGIVFYDAVAGVAYFKSAAPGGVVQCPDPTNHLWAVVHSEEFGTSNAEYVTFYGMTFQGALTVHMQGEYTGLTFDSCKLNGCGFVGGTDLTTGLTLKNNWIDLAGSQYNSYDSGASLYYCNNLDWGFYLYGSNVTITNNLVTRLAGGWITVSPEGLNSSVVTGNIAIDCTHSTKTGGSNLVWQNNIAIQRTGNPYGDNIFWMTSSMVYANNYIESANGLIYYPNNSNILPKITDNIFNMNALVINGSTPEPITAIQLFGLYDPAGLIDRNLYMGVGAQSPGTTSQFFYFDAADYPSGSLSGPMSYYKLSTWASALPSILPGTSGWEANSKQSANTSLFDFTTFGNMLTEGKSQADIASFVIGYVRGIQSAENTSAGPAKGIAAPLLGGRGSARSPGARTTEGARVSLRA